MGRTFASASTEKIRPRSVARDSAKHSTSVDRTDMMSSEAEHPPGELF